MLNHLWFTIEGSQQRWEAVTDATRCAISNAVWGSVSAEVRKDSNWIAVWNRLDIVASTSGTPSPRKLAVLSMASMGRRSDTRQEVRLRCNRILTNSSLGVWGGSSSATNSLILHFHATRGKDVQRKCGRHSRSCPRPPGYSITDNGTPIHN